MKRFFAKFFNEKPHKAIKIPEELKHNLRNSPYTQMALRRAIKEFRIQLPLLSLPEICKLSKAHINAFYFIPNLISSTDPKLEPGLRKSLFADVLDPKFRFDLDYMEERFIVLDRSAEARRNYLLGKEVEAVEKAIRANEELKRIERLREVEKLKYSPDYTEVDQVLDGEISVQMVPVDTHKVISPNGVVVLNKTPGKMARFTDLTAQELSNYICYNLQNVEQALQMFENSEKNEQFDPNMRAKMIQKIVSLEGEKDSFRLIKLIQSVDVSKLNKKNVANTLWAIGKLYETLPKSLNEVVNQLVQKLIEFIPVSNSMNLAYAADGLRKLQIFNKDLVELISARFLNLVDSVNIPKNPTPAKVQYLSIPITGHSYFYGSKDLTIPQTPVPVYSLFKLLKFLSKAKKFEILPYLYQKSSQIINSLSLFELDKKMLFEGLGIFSSLPEHLLQNPSVKSCVINICQQALTYHQELNVEQISLISKSLLLTKSFRLTSWFKVLQLKLFESVSFNKNPDDLLSVTINFVKYFVAVKHGRDLDIEPLVWLFVATPVEDSLFDRISEICRTQNLPDEILNKLSKYLGIIGYSVRSTNEKTCSSIITAAVQGYQHPLLSEVSENDLLSITKTLRSYEDICELAVVFRKNSTKLNWSYFEIFYENNKENIKSQPHRIGLAWSLNKKVEVKYIPELLSKTDYFMLEQIIPKEKNSTRN